MFVRFLAIALEFFFWIRLRERLVPVFSPKDLSSEYGKQGCRALDGVFVCGDYSPEMQRHICRYKYQGQRELVNDFVPAMSKMLTDFDLIRKNAVITSIPIGIDRYIARWFNQSALLAKALSKNLRIPYRKTLFRFFSFSHQARLSRSERKKRYGKFRVWMPSSRMIDGSTVILVDDVVSTWTTLDDAAMTLKRSGARKVFAACIARGI